MLLKSCKDIGNLSSFICELQILNVPDNQETLLWESICLYVHKSEEIIWWLQADFGVQLITKNLWKSEASIIKAGGQCDLHLFPLVAYNFILITQIASLELRGKEYREDWDNYVTETSQFLLFA